LQAEVSFPIKLVKCGLRRSEIALLVLIAFLVAWVLICLAQPLVGLFILVGIFAVFLGFFVFVVAGVVYLKRK
jgi:membrane associated rhomboid family serine protease